MNQTLGKYYQGKPELLQACLNDMERNYDEVVSELEATRARVAALEAALKIFADVSDQTDHLPENNITSRITHGDLREARAVLRGETK